MDGIDRTYTVAETLLSIQGLSMWRGTGDGRRQILRDITVDIKNIIRPNMEQGQVVGLLGPSGIGKSTLFSAIAGFEKPDEGKVLIGTDQHLAAPGQVGVVTQDYTVFPHMTVLQNLVFAGQQGGLTAAQASEKALEYLEAFNLSDQKNSWPMGQLSGGQRQRLAILQQIMIGHQFICMDEPFSGLDVNQVQKVAKLICKITSLSEMLTIIVVTHDIGAAIEVSDTIWMMGKDRDAAGALVDGARITRIYDLIGMGLAWDTDIRHNPHFAEVYSEIVEQFRLLI